MREVVPQTPRVIAVVGPTATGKTRLAEDLAIGLRGEVVTADAMQVYRGMDVGTAKIPVSKRRVNHWCIDEVEPGEPFSAALYQKLSRGVIDDLLAAGKTPVVAGGTGLYVRAALDDMRFPGGEKTSQTRARLEDLAQRLGSEAMHDRLREVDPAAADLIHPNNVRRTIRALEMAEQGVLYSEQAGGFRERKPFYDAQFIGLAATRESLYERIDERVDAMLAAGLLAEVEALLASGFRDALTATQAIGYKEFVSVIEGGANLQEAAGAVKQATRRYAKRQLTWFRADPRVRWIDVTDLTPEQAASAAFDLLSSGRPAGYPEGIEDATPRLAPDVAD